MNKPTFTDPLDQIVNLTQSIFNSKRQIKAADMQNIIKLSQEMKNNIIDSLIPTMANTENRQKNDEQHPVQVSSYASVLKRQPSLPSLQKSTIVVKMNSSDSMQKSTVEKAVCQHLAKNNVPATIHKVTTSSKGNVVFKLNASDDADKIAKTITSSLGMEARAKTLLLPKMTLTNFPSYESMDTDSIKRQILSSNSWLTVKDGSSFEVLFSYQTRRSTNVVLKMSPEIRTQIFNHGCKILIGVRVCSIFDRFHIPVCSKCSSVGHKASNCSSTSTFCNFCSSSEHLSKSCPHKVDKTQHKCSNCAKPNDNLNNIQTTGHNVFSKECPVLLAQKQRLIKSTNWGSGPVPSV